MTGIAICGLGNIGRVHLDNLRSLPGCSLSGVFDASPQVTAEAASSRGVKAFPAADALFEDPSTDAVVLATPTETHLPLTRKALAAGKHVFLEKPIAGTLADAEAIVKAAEASRLCVQIGFCERFNTQYLEARRHVESGVLGPIRAVYTSRVAPFSLGNPAWELGIFDTAVHNLDLILWLKGLFPSSVSVSGTTLYPGSPPVPQSAVIVLEFADGSLATDHITWLQDEAHPLHRCARSRMLLIGEAGSFEIDLSSRPSAVLTRTAFTMPDTVILGGPGYYGCLKLQFEYFLRSIKEGLPVLAPARDALQAERVALAALQSLRSGEKVFL
jgi:predicted dehydrogenase